MKKIKILIILLVSTLFLSCFPEDFGDHLYNNEELQRTFIKNTLSYPIYVESYFVSLTNKNVEDNVLIATNISAYSDIIEIAPGDIKQIMDYVWPNIIKIYAKMDNNSLKLLDEYKNYSLLDPLYIEADNPEENYTFKFQGRATFTPTSEDLEKVPPVDENKYTVDNLPWTDYPISDTFYFRAIDGVNMSSDIKDKTVCVRGIKHRKDSLEDKPVKDVFIKLNPEHENFKLK